MVSSKEGFTLAFAISVQQRAEDDESPLILGRESRRGGTHKLENRINPSRRTNLQGGKEKAPMGQLPCTTGLYIYFWPNVNKN